jgi:hypothetical protein
MAALLTVFTQVELPLADHVDGPMVVQSLAFAAMTLAVAWRRSAPLVAGVMAGAGLAVQTLRCGSSPSGRLRCSGSSPRGCPTPRSLRGSS